MSAMAGITMKGKLHGAQYPHLKLVKSCVPSKNATAFCRERVQTFSHDLSGSPAKKVNEINTKRLNLAETSHSIRTMY